MRLHRCQPFRSARCCRLSRRRSRRSRCRFSPSICRMGARLRFAGVESDVSGVPDRLPSPDKVVPSVRTSRLENSTISRGVAVYATPPCANKRLLSAGGRCRWRRRGRSGCFPLPRRRPQAGDGAACSALAEGAAGVRVFFKHTGHLGGLCLCPAQTVAMPAIGNLRWEAAIPLCSNRITHRAGKLTIKLEA
jgi:hypothetical protein